MSTKVQTVWAAAKNPLEMKPARRQMRRCATDDIVLRAVLLAVLLTFSQTTGTLALMRDLAALAILLRFR